MPTLRIILTAVSEIEFNQALYPGMSLEEAVQYETQAAQDDPNEFVDRSNTKINVDVKVLP